MPIEIKAIKCPQCGSAEKIALGENHYQCKKCGTEYFLDNDDININHNINYPAGGNAPNKKIGKIVGIAVLAWFVIMFFAIVIPSLFHSNKSSTANYGAYESSFPKEKEQWSPGDNKSAAYEDAAGKVVYLVTGLRENTGTQNDKTVYAGFYDAATGKKIKIQQLPAVKSGNLSIDFLQDIRQFEDSSVYFIVNKTALFKVDRKYNTASQVEQNFFQNQPDLQSGIAQIEFVYEDEGDGFKIMTNDGKERYFYPLINKVYNKDKWNDVCFGRTALPENTPVRTAFSFTVKSDDYPEDKIQLIKYQYKIPVGYPRDYPRFKWVKDYGFHGSGIFIYNSNDPHKKVLDYGMSGGRILNPTDFTPGRLYFDAKVLACDNKTVLIKFRPTAAENSPVSLQLLDADTAQILWTYPLNDDLYIYSALKTGQGYFVKGNRYDLFIGNDGKLLKKLDKNELE